VCAPGWRYHPAVIAQGAATLSVMYPGRFWLAIGSGEALNEEITGLPWPPKAERTAQLAEIGGVMQRLWRGETVTHHGRDVVHEAKLYSRPKTPPRLFAAALSAETAAAVAPWADALMTIGGDLNAVREEPIGRVLFMRRVKAVSCHGSPEGESHARRAALSSR
jgi:alkanesulfonate monooxygenase SsuD/methylene tetrahydromethanopterin reductase-like flavin-dependent oxidoreductase (luciferase family)